MADLHRWRKRSGLTQVDAATLLGVSQPYLSLLERGERRLTVELQRRMKAGVDSSDDRFRAQLSALGYPGFAHINRSRSRPSADALLLAVLSKADADSRVVQALPWLVRQCASQMDPGWLVRQAKLQDLQNRLGFVLEVAGVETSEFKSAVGELERARLLQEATLCCDSMPAATRAWMRVHRTALARHWNVLTRLGAGDKDAA
jgi:transcriptional regulator with XRE-family HTH domain